MMAIRKLRRPCELENFRVKFKIICRHERKQMIRLTPEIKLQRDWKAELCERWMYLHKGELLVNLQYTKVL